MLFHFWKALMELIVSISQLNKILMKLDKFMIIIATAGNLLKLFPQTKDPTSLNV
jgi:hypothetical protein